MAKIGRNDACPCGSEKKYKKCCLGVEEQPKHQLKPEEDATSTSQHESDKKVVLKNDDGESMVDIVRKYSLSMRLERVIEKLAPMSLSKKNNSLVKIGYKVDGGVKSFTIHWIRKNDNASQSHTVLGTVFCTLNKLELHVNSEERAKQGHLLLKKYLGDTVLIENIKRQSMDDAKLKNVSESVAHRKQKVFSGPGSKEAIMHHMQIYWQQWFDKRIPMLNNKTPHQAAKTAQGRERLEALFEYYIHSDNRDCKNNFRERMRAPIDYLRKELGM